MSEPPPCTKHSFRPFHLLLSSPTKLQCIAGLALTTSESPLRLYHRLYQSNYRFNQLHGNDNKRCFVLVVDVLVCTVVRSHTLQSVA